jgi:NAD(P)-dependent dehydrogenase (short-subunit alcohol dehydrogenase family)
MSAPRSLRGLRVLVTGASSGIGTAVSRELAGRGAVVAGTGRDAAALAALEVTAAGPLTFATARDLVEAGAPDEVVATAAAALGGLDVVISNAGSGWLGPLAGMPDADLATMVDINLRAPLLVARAAAEHLASSPAGGQLVLVGSIAGLVGVEREVAYGAAKAGLRGLADGLRQEWAGDGVAVTLVSPGPVSTPFFSRRNLPYERSWPKPVPPARVARAIVAAVERRRLDVFVPGWLALPARLNGGWPSLYRLLERPVGRRAL